MKTFYITGYIEGGSSPDVVNCYLSAKTQQEAFRILAGYEAGLLHFSRSARFILETISTRKARGVEFEPLILD